ncbi:MAG: hypothetical protein HWN68_03920 [Desulfobacterales bacterium]|nr:hypothetical protein [Desulfobacterales bacterium]
MEHKRHWKTSEIFISEKTRLHVLSLNIIRSIVKQHGGTMEKDPVTNIITISTPEGKDVVCAQEIEEHVGAMCRCICAQALALFKGKVLVLIRNN